MIICILGDSLTSLSLAKNLVNKKLKVDVFAKVKLAKLSPRIPTFIIIFNFNNKN